MITGNKPRKIKAYLPIDHSAEGFGYVKPEDGESFVGIPYRWVSDNSPPFIQHINKDGIITSTVNALDIFEIIFDVV